MPVKNLSDFRGGTDYFATTPMSDHELLLSFARERSQHAFATLVERHLPLVYSAARRQVRSTHLAEDVAQTVFLDLARRAGNLPPGQSLVAWLHVVTRHTAIDLVRAESRRHAREQTAEVGPSAPEASLWTDIEPMLDEAVGTLGEPDRTAILLRFFQNKSLREVGAALGTSDDAAQKRVTRALDQLRTFFVRRGVTLTAAGLATNLSAFTIETAPAALGAQIASAALLPAAAAPAVAVAARTTAFATAQNSLLVTTAAALLGVAIYETATLAVQRRELAAAATVHAQQSAALAQLTTARTAATARVQQAREAGASSRRLTGPTDPEVEAAVAAWMTRLGRLRQLATERAEFALPELAILSDADWFSAAREAKFDTEEDTRETFRKFHKGARHTLAAALGRALTAYSDAHDGVLPTAPAQLASLLPANLPPALLTRFELLQSGPLAAIAPDEPLLTERADLTQVRDNRIVISRGQPAVEDLTTVPDREFRLAVRAYAVAHDGELPTAAAQLLPHLRTPPGPAARESFLAKPAADFAPAALRSLVTPQDLTR